MSISRMAQVKLHGAWPSPFSYRVIWGLKLKGIPYDYIEEDLSSKSTLLLQYNPIYKKIPVLVHDDKPICESMIILEYLDETWPKNPLLPSDPYERAAARFWLSYIEDKGLTVWLVYRTSGEAQEKAVKESLEMLKTIEEHGFGVGVGEKKKYFGGDKVGIVDIAYGGIAHWLDVIEEVVGIKLLQPHKFPRLHAWTLNFKEAPIIKDSLPDRNQMVVFFKRSREKLLASA